jgi:hypothetical protein
MHEMNRGSSWRVVTFLYVALYGVFLMLQWPAVAAAAPIQGISPRTQFFEGTAFRSFFRLIHKSRGDDDLDILQVPVILSYAFRTDTTVTVVFPYVRKKLEMGGTAFKAGGLGDIRLLGKYRFYRKDSPRGRTQAAALFGLKLPSGSDSETDGGMRLPAPLQPGSGSLDLILGLALGKSTAFYNLEGGVTYKVNSEANDFRFGNTVNYDLSLQYKTYPGWPIRDAQMNLTLELNGVYAAKNETDGVTLANSGGNTLFLSPGVQYILTGNFLLEASGQLPILQDLNGSQLETDYAVLFGFRYLF